MSRFVSQISSHRRIAAVALATAMALPTAPAAALAAGPNPDTRDAAAVSQASPTRTDLRSPDARDAAGGVRVVNLPSVSAPHGTTFQWGDAGIGAGVGILGLVIAAGMTVGVQRHRTRPPSSALPTA